MKGCLFCQRRLLLIFFLSCLHSVPPSRARVTWKIKTSSSSNVPPAPPASDGTIGPFKVGDVPILLCENDDGECVNEIKSIFRVCFNIRCYFRDVECQCFSEYIIVYFLALLIISIINISYHTRNKLFHANKIR